MHTEVFLWHPLIHAKNVELHAKFQHEISENAAGRKIVHRLGLLCVHAEDLPPNYHTLKDWHGQPGHPRRFQLQQVVPNMIIEHTLPQCPGRGVPGCIGVHPREILGK